MAKCAKSVGDLFLPEGETFSSVCLHRSEDVGYLIQYGLLVWTNRQNIRTPEQFSSTAKEIYSSVRLLHTFRREQLWESLMARLQ